MGTRGRLSFCILWIWISIGFAADPKADKVVDLPGLSFEINYDIYSGYLKANEKGNWKMHYWLVESKSDPSTDPILVWFNGGPGCSSFGGAFEELGPFYVDINGETLFENKYSWNEKANVLFLESPVGVGFSYDSEVFGYSVATDAQTRDQNYAALADFFRSFPSYSNRSFFLSGESYAGVYIPMLSAALANGIKKGDFPNPNFMGAAIGNGFMHVEMLTNSMVVWGAYHGMVSVQDWEYVKTTCTKGAKKVGDVDTYNFLSYLTTTNGMDFDSDKSRCGDIADALSELPDLMDPYNIYQDCFNPDWQALGEKRKHGGTVHRAKARRVRAASAQPAGGNVAQNINYGSSDVFWGYPCWNEAALTVWANRPDVWKALHIDDVWQKNNSWTDCNDPMYDVYNMTYPDQTQFFNDFFTDNKNPNFRFLVYNGDVDTACNYLGDSWFVKSLADKFGMNATERSNWYFSNQTAGFAQRYTHPSGPIVDLLTVKGAGHFVPLDRPGAARQMIVNFLFPSGSGPDYNSTRLVSVSPTLSPLLNPQSSSTTPDSSSAPPSTHSLLLSTLFLTAISLGVL